MAHIPRARATSCMMPSSWRTTTVHASSATWVGSRILENERNERGHMPFIGEIALAEQLTHTTFFDAQFAPQRQSHQDHRRDAAPFAHCHCRPCKSE